MSVCELFVLISWNLFFILLEKPKGLLSFFQEFTPLSKLIESLVRRTCQSCHLTHRCNCYLISFFFGRGNCSVPGQFNKFLLVPSGLEFQSLFPTFSKPWLFFFLTNAYSQTSNTHGIWWRQIYAVVSLVLLKCKFILNDAVIYDKCKRVPMLIQAASATGFGLFWPFCPGTLSLPLSSN